MCVCVWLHAASVRQTALFEVAGTGALTAWQAPAGYWPTDGAKGGVYWGNGGERRVEGRGAMATGWGSARSGNRSCRGFSDRLHELSSVAGIKNLFRMF